MAEEANVHLPPVGGPDSPKKPADKVETTAYGGYKLTADIWASLVTLLVGLACPATVLILVCLIAHHTDMSAVQKFVG